MRNHDFDALFKKKLAGNGRGHHGGAKGSGASSLDQRIGQLRGPFGSIVNSKSCFHVKGSFTYYVITNAVFDYGGGRGSRNRQKVIT